VPRKTRPGSSDSLPAPTQWRLLGRHKQLLGGEVILRHFAANVGTVFRPLTAGSPPYRRCGVGVRGCLTQRRKMAALTGARKGRGPRGDKAGMVVFIADNNKPTRRASCLASLDDPTEEKSGLNGSGATWQLHAGNASTGPLRRRSILGWLLRQAGEQRFQSLRQRS
jgi:hypothetical protein